MTATFDLETTPLPGLPQIGELVVGRSRTVTDAEIALLPAMMGAINPLFHDEIAAAATPMGGRVLYGPALLGISVGLTEHLLHGRVIALAEISSIRFRRPVRVGDTVTASLLIAGHQPDDARGRTLLRVEDTVTNQRGETVMTFGRSIFVTVSDHATPA